MESRKYRTEKKTASTPSKFAAILIAESLDALGASLVAGTAMLEREWLEGILAGETPDTRTAKEF